MKNKAFTLIELLVVVLIIGILAAIAVPQYQLAVWKSRFSTIKNLTQSLAQAEEVYFLANGKYTNDFNALDLKVVPPNGTSSYQGAIYYFYDWGYCFLRDKDGMNDVFCALRTNGKDYLAYHKTFINGQWVPNETHCVAYGPNAERRPIASDISYKICTQETNGKYGGNIGGASDFWRY